MNKISVKNTKQVRPHLWDTWRERKKAQGWRAVAYFLPGDLIDRMERIADEHRFKKTVNP